MAEYASAWRVSCGTCALCIKQLSTSAGLAFAKLVEPEPRVRRAAARPRELGLMIGEIPLEMLASSWALSM